MLFLDVEVFYSHDWCCNICVVLFSVVSAATVTRTVVSSSKLRGTHITVENQVIAADVVHCLVVFNCMLQRHFLVEKTNRLGSKVLIFMFFRA